MADQVDNIDKRFNAIIDHGNFNFPPIDNDDNGGGGDDDGYNRFSDIWENIKHFAYMAFLCIATLVPVAVLALIISSLVINQHNAFAQTALPDQIKTTQSNITHAQNAKVSLSEIIKNQQTYIAPATIGNSTIKINAGVCGANRTTAYTITGTLPDTHYYAIYNSLTGQTTSGTYTNINLVPQLIC